MGVYIMTSDAYDNNEEGEKILGNGAPRVIAPTVYSRDEFSEFFSDILNTTLYTPQRAGSPPHWQESPLVFAPNGEFVRS